MRFWRKLFGGGDPPANDEKGEKKAFALDSERDKQKRTAASDTSLTFKQLLTVAQDNPHQANFEMLRLIYARENPYNPDIHLARNERLDSILANSVQKLQQGDLVQARQAVEQVLQENHLYIKAHMVAAVVYGALSDEAQLVYHKAWVEGLLDSIFDSGDGRSHETAFTVIDISEEYDVLRRLGLQPGGQRLSFHKGGMYDVLTVIRPETGDSSELYFRLEHGLQSQASTQADAPARQDGVKRSRQAANPKQSRNQKSDAPAAVSSVASMDLGGEGWAQLENALQRMADEAAAGNTDFCITVESRSDPSGWFQITWDSLNFAYPMTTEPLATIAAMNIGLPDEALLLSYEPGSYVTIENELRDNSALVCFVSRYFEAVFQTPLNDKAALITAENL